VSKQTCSPHPDDCFLAKIDDIYGIGTGDHLVKIGVCGMVCEETPTTVTMMVVLLHLAPRSHGWARWNKALMPPTNYRNLLSRKDDYTDDLRELISIAPRPRSYQSWNALLDLIGEGIGGTGKCVRCLKITPLVDMVHRDSGQGISEFAGLACTACNGEIKEKGSE